MKKIKSTEHLNQIGKNIMHARIKAGLSQKQLSEKLELIPVYICRGSISRIEHGLRAVTDIEIDALAKVLNTDPNTLFDWHRE